MNVYERNLITELEVTLGNELYINSMVMELTQHMKAMLFVPTTIATLYDISYRIHLQYVLNCIETFMNTVSIIEKLIQLKMPRYTDLDSNNKILGVWLMLRNDISVKLELFSKHVSYFFDTLKERKDFVDAIASNNLRRDLLFELEIFDKHIFDLLKQDLDKLSFSYIDIHNFTTKNKLDFKISIDCEVRRNHHLSNYN
jgi:hypothetical protein